MLINGHMYQFQLQSVNGLLRRGLSNIITKTPQPPPIPPASRTKSITTGWIQEFNVFDYYQLYDVTGMVSGFALRKHDDHHATLGYQR
ncbi:MAG TPA: hypothetical protein VFC19_17735 [Candidatus Limnocylindrales bacterium]|nr:hypothetical protein [Candidatus Limnocylindrales bacterium]